MLTTFLFLHRNFSLEIPEILKILYAIIDCVCLGIPRWCIVGYSLTWAIQRNENYCIWFLQHLLWSTCKSIRDQTHLDMTTKISLLNKQMRSSSTWLKSRELDWKKLSDVVTTEAAITTHLSPHKTLRNREYFGYITARWAQSAKRQYVDGVNVL